MQVEEIALKIEAIRTSVTQMHSHILCEQNFYEKPCRSFVVRVTNFPLYCDCNHICRRRHHFGKQCGRDQRVEV
jgi:hypothetical protein